ncbi:hypothetical protein OWV82_020860 [Melia azedarach]|uniref:Uncharacterized protein n=1 Tax=Melia azedarach TaxID=155640 RepID=A0ACC1X869_MELAZ|nr:hypothetical protein OWV82_020860 [Melia azedarach]
MKYKSVLLNTTTHLLTEKLPSSSIQLVSNNSTKNTNEELEISKPKCRIFCRRGLQLSSFWVSSGAKLDDQNRSTRRTMCCECLCQISAKTELKSPCDLLSIRSTAEDKTEEKNREEQADPTQKNMPCFLTFESHECKVKVIGNLTFSKCLIYKGTQVGYEISK